MQSTAIIAAFRSREQTLKLLRIARENGIACSAVNTPREAGVACGISVSFCPDCFPHIKRIISCGGFERFIGFFKVTSAGYRTAVERI